MPVGARRRGGRRPHRRPALGPAVGPTRVPEVGWRLGRRFWGRGTGTAAGRLALERALALGVPRVVAMVHTDNVASLSVARKLGLPEEPAPITVRSSGPPVRRRVGSLLTDDVALNWAFLVHRT
ncbi:GNAT family N-acetyltransferase [Geodermatophilus sp. SYSU D00710]